MNFFRNQDGNVFFALFGAVAFVGVLGAATMSFMKGPLKTSVTLSRMSVAETQMQVASQMAVLQASTEADSGDCDADGFVEPMEWKDQADDNLRPNAIGGVGTGAGGNIPDTLGASKNDPWGQLYGYCVWNSGTNAAIDAVPACDDDGSATEERLEGSPNNYDIVMAVISAGPDRTFQTVCQTFDAADANDNDVLGDVGDTEMVFKTGGSDDVILAYTYAEAATIGGGGLWSIKSSDPGTATIDKAIEFTGGLTMGTEIDVTICSLDTLNQMRYNGVTDLIQVCDGSSWVDMSGGATPAGNETEIQFNTGGVLDADTGLRYDSGDDALSIDGSVTLGAITDADLPVLISNPSVTSSGTFEVNADVVRNSGDHATEDFVFGSPQLADTGDTNHDNRMFFDKGLGAFRAGTATGAQWDTVGISSIALGSNAQATNNNTVAIGTNNTASGGQSFVAGFQSTSSGNGSVALGYTVTAAGDGSVALGAAARTTAAAARSLAVGLGSPGGSYPQVSGSNSFGIFMGDQSGVDITASNSMVLLGGNFGIENIAPDVELDVTGDIEYSGTITDVSDIRMKENVAPLASSLDKVTSLEGISFTMRDDEKGRVELGFSAQDVQKVYPELIKTADDEIGSLSMNYVGLIAPLVESVKELKSENETLRTRLEALENDGNGGRNSDHEKWIYLLIGVIIGHCLLHILRHKCCSKKEG